MDLSVVLAARNEEEHLQEQLDALQAQDFAGDWELIVVDNGSTDSTAAMVEGQADADSRVRLVGANERPCKSYALNVGVAAAQADKIAFCDGDDVVTPGWLSSIASGLETYDVVTGPHELDRLNPPWLADSRGRSIEVESVGSFFGIFPTVRGASWGVSREAWKSLGGMNEDYHALEDLEFSYRCWRAGIEIGGLPAAVIHYRYRRSPRDLWRQGFTYGLYRPRIARIVNQSGDARVPRFAGWKSWVNLAIGLPTLLRSEGRAAWLWIAANRVGQLVGSVRERTIVL